MPYTALDAGVNVIDTADVYSDGESERLVGAALRGGVEGPHVRDRQWPGPLPERAELRLSTEHVKLLDDASALPADIRAALGHLKT